MITKVSIIVPIYKVEKEIHRCVESLLNQTLTEIEIILVNDGSPDKCPQICDEFAEKDNRIRVLHKDNGGLSDARNYGLLEARGEYVLFVDSDDYIDKRTCEIFFTSVQDDVDIIVGDGLRIEGEKELLMRHAYIPAESVLSGADFLKVQLKSKKMYMVAWLNLYNRKFLINNDLFFKKGIFHEDEQWTPRVFLVAQKVKYLRFPFYNYVIRENSITRKKDKTKNGIDLISTCYELEDIYLKLKDKDLQILLNDYLVMLFLSAINIGNLYGTNFKETFLIGKAKTIKNKLRVLLFVHNKSIYCKLKYVYTVFRVN